MRKNLIFSVFAFIYIVLFKVTKFETGEVFSATILLEIGVPLFVLISFILLFLNLYKIFKEKLYIQSPYFLSSVINIITLIMFFLFH